MADIDRKKLAADLCGIAERAGAEILEIYNSDFEVRGKTDSSPVTDADERGERLIMAELAKVAPDIPIVAEEAASAGTVPDIEGKSFFLVDPLDGTKEFINRNGEFTVNIALVENRVPTVGVVYLPALSEMFWSDGESGAWRKRGDGAPEQIACRKPGADGLVVVASRSHRDSKTDDYLAQFKVKDLVSAGSSLKLCRVAEGAADMYPRLGRTMEWDIAAGHAVLAGAGGSVSTIEGDPLTYGKDGLDNPFFVARGLPD